MSFNGLWWFDLAVLAGVFVIAAAALLTAAVALRLKTAPAMKTRSANEQLQRRAIVSALIITAFVLLTLLGLELASQGRRRLPPPGNALPVNVTAHQWWWEVDYLDETASRTVTGASEMHLPLGLPVRINLQSADTVHSFWIPKLTGNIDAVPGRPSSLWFVPERAGVYEAHCGEWCGPQRAPMRLTVRVEPRASFDAWLKAQRQLAQPAPPDDAGRNAGAHKPAERTTPGIFPATDLHALRGDLGICR